MDFAPSEAQEITRKSVRSFAEQEIVPQSRAFDESQEFPHAWAKKMGELGLFGVFVPEKYGGSGLDTVCYAITIEELSRGDASAGVIAAVCNGLVCEPLLRYGTEEQKRKYLRPVARGEWIGAYALTEPGSGSDAAAMRTTAELRGDHWVLNGTKSFATNASVAQVIIGYARTGRQKHEISAFIIPTDADGFSVLKKEDKMGIRASDTVSLGFDGMKIPKENLLGELHKGFNIAMATLDGGRIGIAAQALGIGQRALDESTKYAKEREAFGQKIADFQAIQWKLADMATEIEAARLLTYRAAQMEDLGRRHTYESSVAKLFASEAAHRAVDAAVQIHGGYGFIKDYVVEKLYRDQRVTEIYEGTSEIQRLVIARAVLGK
ncbi:MAG: acyl-CoA dehydrogenase [Methanobacteriota archaeon]|nr:MAG: acyl-CoA dehydrogenase [Euryarchaeota archaeon]